MNEDDSAVARRDALESDRPERRAAALSELADTAETDPASVVDAVPLVATFLDADARSVRRDATLVLGRVAESYPEAVKPAVPQLVDAIESGDVPAGAMVALGRVAKAYPAVAAPLVDTFVGFLDDENPMIRNNALACLADVSQESPSALRPHTARVVELLEDDADVRIRYNATSVLSSVAREFPEEVASVVPRFRELLTVDHKWTRYNACWALGYLRADEALSDLADVAEGDPDEAVRRAAERAVERIRE